MEEVGQRGGKPCSQHRLKQMFAAADLNHNGVVDFNEFCYAQLRKRESSKKSRSRRSSPANSVAGDDTPRSWPNASPRTWPTPPMTPRDPLDSPSTHSVASTHSCLSDRSHYSEGGHSSHHGGSHS